jgi:hypothetical protein
MCPPSWPWQAPWDRSAACPTWCERCGCAGDRCRASLSQAATTRCALTWLGWRPAAGCGAGLRRRHPDPHGRGRPARDGDQARQLSELLAVGLAQELEQHRLGAGDHRARLAELVQLPRVSEVTASATTYTVRHSARISNADTSTETWASIPVAASPGRSAASMRS